MRVWILNHYAITPSQPGGARHYRLAKVLITLGWEVTIFASSFNHFTRCDTHPDTNKKWYIEMIDGIRFIWIKTPSYEKNDIKRVLNMLSFMIRSICIGIKLSKNYLNLSKPDIVIGSSVHLFAVCSALLLSKFHKARFVMEVRDLWPQTLIDMRVITQNSLIAKSLRWLENFLYRKTDMIITVLPDAWKYITSYNIDKRKIVWIPNGFVMSQQKISYQQPKDGFTVMYIGAHGQANSLEVIIEAANLIQNRNYQDIKIVLIGDGPEKESLINKAEQLSLNNISFQDPIPSILVPEMLEKANCTVVSLHDIPLYKYGISLNKLFDYLAAGRPILFAGISSNNPIREANCGICVPPNDPIALTEAILQLHSASHQELEEMGKRAREYVAKDYDYEILGDKLHTELLQLIKSEI